MSRLREGEFGRRSRLPGGMYDNKTSGSDDAD